jgi:hypothetical protein
MVLILYNRDPRRKRAMNHGSSACLECTRRIRTDGRPLNVHAEPRSSNVLRSDPRPVRTRHLQSLHTGADGTPDTTLLCSGGQNLRVRPPRFWPSVAHLIERRLRILNAAALYADRRTGYTERFPKKTSPCSDTPRCEHLTQRLHLISPRSLRSMMSDATLYSTAHIESTVYGCKDQGALTAEPTLLVVRAFANPRS